MVMNYGEVMVGGDVKKVMILDLIQDHRMVNHLIFNLVNMGIHHLGHIMFLDPVLVQ